MEHFHHSQISVESGNETKEQKQARLIAGMQHFIDEEKFTEDGVPVRIEKVEWATGEELAAAKMIEDELSKKSKEDEYPFRFPVEKAIEFLRSNSVVDSIKEHGYRRELEKKFDRYGDTDLGRNGQQLTPKEKTEHKEYRDTYWNNRLAKGPMAGMLDLYEIMPEMFGSKTKQLYEEEKVFFAQVQVGELLKRKYDFLSIDEKEKIVKIHVNFAISFAQDLLAAA